jgi:hypothetical protein
MQKGILLTLVLAMLLGGLGVAFFMSLDERLVGTTRHRTGALMGAYRFVTAIWWMLHYALVPTDIRDVGEPWKPIRQRHD